MRITIVLGMLFAGLAMATPGQAEQWQVTAGDFHSVWQMTRSSDGGLEGTGATPDANKLPVKIWGSGRSLMAHGDDVTCGYIIHKLSTDHASGIGSCAHGSFDWSAVITGAVAELPAPSLFTTDTDPRLGAAYQALPAATRFTVDAEVKTYLGHMEYSFAGVRDTQCLADQYLHIRLQRPDWSPQQVSDFVQWSCISPEKEHLDALAHCHAVYDTSLAKDHPTFCSCYADDYTRQFVAKPNNTTIYASELGVTVAQACRAKL